MISAFYVLMIVQSTPCFVLSVAASFHLTRSLDLARSPFQIQNQTFPPSVPNNLSDSTLASSPVGTSSDSSIPRTFQYDHDPYKVIYTHGPVNQRYPGVTPYNWRAAVNLATENLQAMEVLTHAEPEDPVHGNRFDFDTTLVRPAPRHRYNPRQLKFEIMPAGDAQLLKYEEVEIILLGLKEYTVQFERRAANDQVRMCTFYLFYKEEHGDSLLAKGSVSLIIPS